MRTYRLRVCALALLVLAVGCKHNLDDLFADTVAEAGTGGGGTGGRASGSGGGGTDSDEDSGTDTGSGGAGGSGSGGAGVEQPSDRCKPCLPKLSSELEDKGIEFCCRGVAQGECGLTFGVGDKAMCLPRMVPGVAVAQCPPARSGAIKLDGCCRPDARCGYQSDGAVLGAFGCVAREEIPTDFLTGVDTSPIACTFECEDDNDCNALPGNFVCTPNPKNGDQRICAKSCQRDADCTGGDRICGFGVDLAMNRVNAFCQAPIGQLSAGDECTGAEECGSGVCQFIDALDHPELGGLCSQLCINDRDCTAGPSCDNQGIHRPKGDEVQEFRVCANPK